MINEKELSSIFETAKACLSARYAEEERIEEKMAALKVAGILDAQVSWPKDKPGAMQLLFSIKSDYYQKTGKRRRYVGKSPVKQAEAKASLQRYQDYRTLVAELNRVQAKQYFIENLIRLLQAQTNSS